jgi:hypothetical protein
VSAKHPVNKAASIRQKLLNHAKAKGQDFQRTIDEYAAECLLDRLTRSPHADKFVLKGALLFAVWRGLGARPTRDVDFMGRGDSDIAAVVKVFRAIASIDIEDDGVVFFPDRTIGQRIKEDDEYEGVRIVVEGELSGATFRTQVDIGFGDAVTPAPVPASFPRLLGGPSFSLLTYPPETVFAEKLHAIVVRGLLNSRMKDYYDLWVLVRERMVRTGDVRLAIARTFERRRTPVPAGCPTGLTREFAQDAIKLAQWKSFVKKSGLDAGELTDVVTLIQGFVGKVYVDWGNAG